MLTLKARSYATTRPWQVSGIAFVKSDDGLLLETPVMDRQRQEGVLAAVAELKTCLDLYVHIEVRPGLVLRNWAISAGNLDIIADAGLFDPVSHDDASSPLRVHNSSSFNAVRGDLHVEYWSSRSTHIDLTSGSLQGTFALRDQLFMRLRSGSIDVDVVPKKADPKAPAPAEFRATSTSGSVKVEFPMAEEIPSRQYRTQAESSSGMVSGSYLLGEETSLQTISGMIQAALRPHYNASTKSMLTAQSRSGAVRLDIRDASDARGGGDGGVVERPWKGSTHSVTTVSGAVSLQYKDWSGVFEGQTISGSFSVKGKNLRIIEGDENSPLWKHVVAIKGIDGGRAVVKTHTGFIEMLADDEA